MGTFCARSTEQTYKPHSGSGPKMSPSERAEESGKAAHKGMVPEALARSSMRAHGHQRFLPVCPDLDVQASDVQHAAVHANWTDNGPQFSTALHKRLCFAHSGRTRKPISIAHRQSVAIAPGFAVRNVLLRHSPRAGLLEPGAHVADGVCERRPTGLRSLTVVPDASRPYKPKPYSNHDRGGLQGNARRQTVLTMCLEEFQMGLSLKGKKTNPS